MFLCKKLLLLLSLLYIDLYYSKTCLQGTPQYPRESVPTRQVLQHGEDRKTVLRKCPLVTVSLEDRFYCILYSHLASSSKAKAAITPGVLSL